MLLKEVGPLKLMWLVSVSSESNLIVSFEPNSIPPKAPILPVKDAPLVVTKLLAQLRFPLASVINGRPALTPFGKVKV